jgi:hypothetical protein
VISDTDLLQANATLITGIFIFLTLAPVSRKVAVVVFEKKRTLYFTLGVLFFLISSVIQLVLPGYESLELAKYYFIIGLSGIPTIIISILARLHMEPT